MATNNQGNGAGGFPMGQQGKVAGGNSMKDIDSRPIGRKEVGPAGQAPGGKLGNTFKAKGGGFPKGGGAR